MKRFAKQNNNMRSARMRDLLYHLGKTKKEILKTALDVLSTQFYGLSKKTDEKKTNSPESFTDSLVAAQRLISIIPAISVFYVKSRSGNKELRGQAPGHPQRRKRHMILEQRMERPESPIGQ